MSNDYEMQADVDATEIQPVAVRVVGNDTDEIRAADKSGASNWQLLGTEAPFRVVGRQGRRSKATIKVGPGLPGGNVAGFVLFGPLEKVANGQGAILFVNQTIEYEAAPELWCATDGSHSLTISVIDEWYLS